MLRGVMDVLEAIRLRRSIKPDKMKPDPVDPALIERMFEAANWAPSHGLTEPWRFIVFRGDARKALIEAIASTMVPEDQTTLPPDDARREKLVRNFMTPPMTIAIVCATSTNPKIIPHEEIASTAMAVQNLQLAARALGVATYWTSGEKAFHPRMAKFLGIEPPAKCLGFLYVGYPAIPWPEGTRRPVTEKVTWR
jgi:nitroreductase